MGAGFPTRPDRGSFGPEMINTRAVRDPRREIDAALLNLLWHQIAGSGQVVPRVLLHFTAQPSPVIIGRVEAWNPKRLTSAPFVDPGITENATGHYFVDYTSPVEDETGTDVVVSFQWAMGFCVNAAVTTLKHVQCSTPVATPNRIEVAIFDAAGALENGNNVVVAGW